MSYDILKSVRICTKSNNIFVKAKSSNIAGAADQETSLNGETLNQKAGQLVIGLVGGGLYISNKKSKYNYIANKINNDLYGGNLYEAYTAAIDSREGAEFRENLGKQFFNIDNELKKHRGKKFVLLAGYGYIMTKRGSKYYLTDDASEAKQYNYIEAAALAASDTRLTAKEV